MRLRRIFRLWIFSGKGKSNVKGQKSKVLRVVLLASGLEVVMSLLVTSEISSYFVGLDLGQRRDYSALAVVERTELILDLDYVTYERRREMRYRVPFVERVRLGTPYPDVVQRVREVLRRPHLAGRCTLTMDATGVGAPVLDLLRAADLGCAIAPVILTGGERESHTRGMWHVSRQSRKFRFQRSIRYYYLVTFPCHSLMDHRLASRPPVKAALRRATPARP